MTGRELFLDTTYVMPFFYLDITVRGFSRSRYKELLGDLNRIHFSEVSIIEAKTKCLKLSKTRPEALERFLDGLAIVGTDERVVIHGYRAGDDRRFNALLGLGLGLFDALILAQAFTVGTLLTEDHKLLRVREPGLTVLNWELATRDR